MGSFGQVVRFTPASKEQLLLQIENKNGYRSGVAVRLYSKAMADNSYYGTGSKSPVKYIRVWMDAEYDILTRREVRQLKKEWDELDPQTVV